MKVVESIFSKIYFCIWNWGSQFRGRLIRSPGSPRRRKGSGALEVQIRVWNSQGGGKDKLFFVYIPSVEFSSVAQSCPTLCDPMNRNTLGLLVHHHLPEFIQTHFHHVGDAIQCLILYCPLLLLPPIPPSIRVFSKESTLRMRWPKYWSFSFSISPSNENLGLISFRKDWLDLLESKGLSRVFSNITVQKHQFFGAQLSSQSNSHIHTWPLEKP